jgi:hypothetical protein
MHVSGPIPRLHVEGKDDLYVIASLLERHGVRMDEVSRPLKIQHHDDDDPKRSGDTVVLEVMAETIKNATDRPVGFVIDIDLKTSDRWASVSAALKAAGLSPPKNCPADGYVAQVPGYPHQVGVWLMPDCISDHCKLEHLLTTLVRSDDPLWPHAETATLEAKKKGAEFTNGAMIKAVVHCWLAWRKDPGVPFGTAIKAKFFGHDSNEAKAFLRWLGKLYGIQPLTTI